MTKYLINGFEFSKDDFYGGLESAIQDSVAEYFDEELDEVYDRVEICGVTFYPSQILHELDPTAYNCAMDDQVSNELDDANWELENYGYFELGKQEFRIEEEAE